MANTSVLDPFSIKPRETAKVNPRDQVGGTMEYVEEVVGGAMDLIFKGPEGPFVNEGPVRSPDLEQIRQMPENKIEPTGFSPEGSITGFQNQRSLVDTSPEARVSNLEAEQFKVWREHIAKAPVEEKRVNINELDKLQVSYRGSVDNEGNVTDYHQAEADKKQSENIALSIQQEREEKLVKSGTGRKTSPKAAVGPQVPEVQRDLNKQEETAHGITKLTG